MLKLFADLSTGAHSPLISQGNLALLFQNLRKEDLFLRRLRNFIHARRHEAENRLNAAENNLKRQMN